MQEPEILIFPVFPHIIKVRFTGVTLTFLEDEFIWEQKFLRVFDARRAMPYAAIKRIEIRLDSEHPNTENSILIIRDSWQDYYPVGKEPIHLGWDRFNTEQQSEIIKILRTQAPQAQYNDAALEAFRPWL